MASHLPTGGLPVPNVQINILGANLQRTTSKRGYCQAKGLNPGAYQITTQHPNFVDQTVDFTVVVNETTEVVITLVENP